MYNTFIFVDWKRTVGNLNCWKMTEDDAKSLVFKHFEVAIAYSVFQNTVQEKSSNEGQLPWQLSLFVYVLYIFGGIMSLVKSK